MADLYAVAAGGNWNNANTWSSTSGGAGGAGTPTAADDVYLDANSGNVTINAFALARKLDCTGYTGTLTHNAVELRLGTGSGGASNIALKLVAGMTYTPTTGSLIGYVGGSGTSQSFTTAGKTVDSVNVNATGSLTISDALTVTNRVTLTQGTLNTNNQTCSWGEFNSANSNTRTFTPGSSTITITGTGNAWNTSTVVNLTVTANTSTIVLSGANATFVGGNNQHWYNISLTGSGAAGITQLSRIDNNLTRTGTAAKTDSLLIGTSGIVVSGTFTCNGNSAINRILVQSNSTGSSASINAATVSVTNTDFMDITGAGAGSWDLSAVTGGSGDCGGNSGITFTTAATQTWSGTSGGNWSTNAWTSRVPLPQDDASFNGVAFSASQNVTLDMPRSGKNINFTGCTGNPNLVMSFATSIFGSLTLIAGLTRSSNATYTFAGRGTHTITTSGVSMATTQITSIGGSYTLQDAYTSIGGITLNNGTFDANDHNVTCTVFNSSNSNTRTLDMGSGTWNLTTTAGVTIWDLSTTTNLTFSGANSTIVLPTSTNNKNFAAGNLTYGNFYDNQTGTSGQLKIQQGSPSFNDFHLNSGDNARTLLIDNGLTVTIRGTFDVNGKSGKLVSIKTSTLGVASTLSKSSGVVSCDYLSIQDSTATGGASWFAGANSTNVSGNTGWIFTPPFIGIGTEYVSLSQAERSYFVRKVGGANPNEPLNNIKRRYFMGYLGGTIDPRTSLEQLEKLWLAKVATTAGLTVTNFKNVSDLWKLAVLSITLVPTNHINENKARFYLNAP